MIEIALAAVFLVLSAVNVSVARDVRHIAKTKPRIDLLAVVSWLVTILALGACVFGLFSIVAVVRLITGAVLIPPPFPAVIFVAMALTLSAANLLVRRYLRQKRALT